MAVTQKQKTMMLADCPQPVGKYEYVLGLTYLMYLMSERRLIPAKTKPYTTVIHSLWLHARV